MSQLQEIVDKLTADTISGAIIWRHSVSNYIEHFNWESFHFYFGETASRRVLLYEDGWLLCNGDILCELEDAVWKQLKILQEKKEKEMATVRDNEISEKQKQTIDAAWNQLFPSLYIQ